MSAPETPKTTNETARAPRLTDLEPAEILALPAEHQEEWKRQDRRECDDFHFLQRFVLDLYPSVHRYFKRSRAEDYFGDFSKPSDGPLYDAFEMLLTLADDFRADPEMAGRLRGRCLRYRASVAGRKAAKKATAPPRTQAQTEQTTPPPGPEPGAACPDCGSALDINSARCPVCRRFIG